MTTSFPSGLDALTNPTSANGLNSPDHAGQHADANDAIEALEAKVGINSSAVTSSLDYKITNINASNLASGTVPSARVSGAYTGVTSVGTLGSLTVTGDVTVDTNTLKVDSTNNRVGIANASPAYTLDVNGTIEGTQFLQGTDYLSPYQGFRNKIINGDFSIWQRGGTGGYTPTAGNMEGADRWITWWNGTGGTRSVSRSTFALGQTAVPDNPKHHMTINTSVIGSGQTVTDFWQRIENVNTFAGQTATLSFWWKSTSAATQASPFITQNFGTGGSPSAAVDTFLTTTSLASANTWTRYSVSVALPSISGKTLGTSGDYLLVGLRFLTTVACTIDISSVQLEQGSVSTPFEQRPSGTEFALCQRYYQTSYSNGTAVPTNNSQGGIVVGGAPSVANLAFVAHVNFPVVMRISPTVAVASYTSSQANRVSDAYSGTDQGATSGNVVYIGSTGFSVYNTSGVTMTSLLGFMFHYAAQAEL